MKLHNILLTLLPLAAASPTRRGPLGGTLITDPERLSRLEALHAQTLQGMQTREPTYVSLEDLKSVAPAEPGLERRFIVLGLAGVAVFELVEALVDILGNLAEKLTEALTDQSDETWYDTAHCRTFYQTQGGANEVIKTYDRDSSDATVENDFKLVTLSCSDSLFV